MNILLLLLMSTIIMDFLLNAIIYATNFDSTSKMKLHVLLEYVRYVVRHDSTPRGGGINLTLCINIKGIYTNACIFYIALWTNVRTCSNYSKM